MYERKPTYQFIQGALHLQVSCTKYPTFCCALYLCLILDASVQVIQDLALGGRFLHEMMTLLASVT